jgi:hypothetical protein
MCLSENGRKIGSNKLQKSRWRAEFSFIRCLLQPGSPGGGLLKLNQSLARLGQIGVNGDRGTQLPESFVALDQQRLSLGKLSLSQ